MATVLVSLFSASTINATVRTKKIEAETFEVNSERGDVLTLFDDKKEPVAMFRNWESVILAQNERRVKP